LPAVIERRYALTKIAAGDYLLPGNDARSLWRITRGEETVPVESGADRWRHEYTRRVIVWEAWRYTAGRITNPPDLPDDFLDWSHWSCEASWCDTRAEAIREALRMSSA